MKCKHQALSGKWQTYISEASEVAQFWHTKGKFHFQPMKFLRAYLKR